MTPTLVGRSQTRALLLLTLGVVASLPFVAFRGVGPLLTLGIVLVLGFVWDVVYDWIQKGRWDRDWPAAYQFAAGVWEGAVTYGVVLGLSTRGDLFSESLITFVDHYAVVWFLTFVASQSLMRIAFPSWRYNGGRWLS